MKLGTGGPDAVNKSSITWACTGRLAEKKKRIKDEQDRIQKLNDSQPIWQAMKERLKDKGDMLAMVDEQLEDIKIKRQTAVEQAKLLSKRNTTAGLDQLAMRLANTFWTKQCKLSLLVAAGSWISEDLKKAKPEIYGDDAHEYYRLVSGEAADALFGREFLSILGTLET